MSKKCQEATIIDTLERLCDILSVRVSLKTRGRKSKKRQPDNEHNENPPDQTKENKETKINNDKQTTSASQNPKKPKRRSSKKKQIKHQKKQSNPPNSYCPIPLNPLTQNAKCESTQVEDDVLFEMIENQKLHDYANYLQDSYELLSYLTVKKQKSRCFSKWAKHFYISAVNQNELAQKHPQLTFNHNDNHIVTYDYNEPFKTDKKVETHNSCSSEGSHNPHIYQPHTLLYTIPSGRINDLEPFLLNHTQTSHQEQPNLCLSKGTSNKDANGLTNSKKDFYADIVLSEFS